MTICQHQLWAFLHQIKVKSRGPFLSIPSCICSFGGAQPSRGMWGSSPWSSAVQAALHSAVLYSPLVTGSLRGHWISCSLPAPQGCCIPKHKQEKLWLCDSGVLRPIQTAPWAPWPSQGTETTHAVNYKPSTRLSSPHHPSNHSPGMPPTYHLTPWLSISMKQKTRNRKKKKSNPHQHVCLESQLEKNCLP